ncbi:MAG: hypothetical protein OXH16_03290 [Gemmatimonadetes bacterium]|nr:hypothetical protein [Gemmatimonadota bacterium]
MTVKVKYQLSGLVWWWPFPRWWHLRHLKIGRYWQWHRWHDRLYLDGRRHWRYGYTYFGLDPFWMLLPNWLRGSQRL